MKRESRFRIQITKTGYLFIALNLGIGIAGLNTGNNLLYLIFSMMLSFIVLSGILSNNALLGLVFFPEFPHRIFANDFIPVELTLKNEKKWFSSFSLSFATLGQKFIQSQQAYIVKIHPGEIARTVDHVQFQKRGRIRLPDYQVETSYPFGLIRKFTKLHTEGETLVYPKLLPIQSLLSFEQKYLGDFLSGLSGGLSNPYGIRDYVFGDPAKNIHWKSSARTQELKVKEFEKEKRFRIHLVLWLANKSASEEVLKEKAISLTASLMMDFIGRNYEVSLSILGEKIEPHGRGYTDAFLSALALTEAPSKPIQPTIENEKDTLIWLTDLPAISKPSGVDFIFGRSELKSL